MANYKHARVPDQGEALAYENGELRVPDKPIIPFIEGDGTGPDIWRASVRVFDAAVQKAYGGQRKVAWMEIFAGEKAFNTTGNWLPDETVEACAEFRVSIKGPLTTPVGGGIRSLNVTLRQVLDLYACVRPVRYFQGVGAPVKEPQKLDVVIFRENIEDVYSGIEFKAGSAEANRLRSFLKDEFKKEVREESAIGIKPMSAFGSKRLVDAAIRYALKTGRSSVTLVHKGNIMKFTEGAFRDWGYELAKEKYGHCTITEADVSKAPKGAKIDSIVIKDRIADAMFQQLLLRPDEYSVIATPNLNGDYLSDAAAAQVGGLGLAPKYAGLDKINPGSVILSGVMLFDYLGWDEVGKMIMRGMEKAISGGTVTYDLARQMPGAKEVSTTAFADAIIAGMGA
jgi:isocitrate dehydrogenase